MGCHAPTSLRPRSRRAGGILLALLIVLGFATACESTDAERNEVINLVNQTRAAHGLKPVTQNVTLNVKADKWAQKLRNECRLSHSRLADGAPPEWKKLGENVGYGGSIAQVHDAYLNSPGHRANILDPSYNQMGAAAVWGMCNGTYRVFTVQVFMRS